MIGTPRGVPIKSVFQLYTISMTTMKGGHTIMSKQETQNHGNEVNFENYSRRGLIQICNGYDTINNGALSDYVYQQEADKYDTEGKNVVYDAKGFIVPIYFEQQRNVEKIVDAADRVKDAFSSTVKEGKVISDSIKNLIVTATNSVKGINATVEVNDEQLVEA